MRKLIMLLIALIVIGVGFLSGCEEQQSNQQQHIPYQQNWRPIESFSLQKGEYRTFGCPPKWKIEWSLVSGSGNSFSATIYKGQQYDNIIFGTINSNNNNGEKIFNSNEDGYYTLTVDSESVSIFRVLGYY